MKQTLKTMNTTANHVLKKMVQKAQHRQLHLKKLLACPGDCALSKTYLKSAQNLHSILPLNWSLQSPLKELIKDINSKVNSTNKTLPKHISPKCRYNTKDGLTQMDTKGGSGTGKIRQTAAAAWAWWLHQQDTQDL